MLLVATLLASLAAEAAPAQARSVAIIVARGPGLAATLTKGLALKLAVEAQRRGLSQLALLGDAGTLPAEDDPFFASCFSDDDCLLRLCATAEQAVLLVIVDGPPDQRRTRVAFVHEGLHVLVRHARELPAPFARSVEQEAMATLEAGIARLPVVAVASALPSSAEAARRKTLRLWKVRCAVCHGLDGKGHTVMGLKLNVADMGDKAWQSKVNERKVKGWLVEGSTFVEDPDHEMASLSKLPLEQVEALIAYVRTLGN